MNGTDPPPQGECPGLASEENGDQHLVCINPDNHEIKEQRLVFARTVALFDVQAQGWLKQGWQPFGGIATVYDGMLCDGDRRFIYVQAFVKRG